MNKDINTQVSPGSGREPDSYTPPILEVTDIFVVQNVSDEGSMILPSMDGEYY